MHEVDIAIIGAGSAGLNARKEAERAGASWVLIDPGPYGTTCARVGCMPSKLFIAAVDAAHHVASASTFGIAVDDDGWRVDGAAVFERIRAERDRFVGFVVEATEAIPAEQRIKARARFIEPTLLETDDGQRISARAVVVATGSRPWIPPVLSPIQDRVLVNDDIFELRAVPESIAVFGTGIIGLELGQALHRLGCRVTFFNPFDVVGPFTDPVVATKARDVLAQELDLRLGGEIGSVAEHNGAIEIRSRDAEGATRVDEFQAVLAAAGRRPRIEELGLDRAGVPCDGRGVPMSDPRTMQCGNTPVFVAGDVSGHRPLLHEAADEGRIAGANAARYPDVVATVRRTPLAIAFTSPQMALVGKRFDELDKQRVEIGEVSYDDQGRARVMGQNSGHVRIYGDRESCAIVGAEMLGPAVEHTAHLLAWAVQQRMTVQRALQMPFYHPVVEEGIRTALRDLATRLRVTGNCPPEDCATAPGT